MSNKNKYYGYNPVTKKWLKSFGSLVTTTQNFAEATKHKKAYVEQVVKQLPDAQNWEAIMETQAIRISEKVKRASNAKVAPEAPTTATTVAPKSSAAKRREQKMTDAQIRAALRGHSSVWRGVDLKANIQSAIEDKDAIYLTNVADRYNVRKVLTTLLVEKDEQISQTDLMMADVYHYVMAFSLPANVSVQVYRIQQEILSERAKLKQERDVLREVKHLVEADDDNLRRQLESTFAEKRKSYHPRTEVFSELLSLYSKKEEALASSHRGEKKVEEGEERRNDGLMSLSISQKMEEVSQAALMLSDVYHYIFTHNPPAHIRTKVIGIEKQVLEYQARVQAEKDILVAIAKNYTAQTSSTDYVPKTDVYARLTALYA